jgi:hypothetical protein
MTQREVGLRRPDSAVRTRSNKSPRLRTGAGNFYAVAVNGVLPIRCESTTQSILTTPSRPCRLTLAGLFVCFREVGFLGVLT